MLDPKTSQMFYFTGKNHTTPNCPLEMVPNFNPSAGVPSYRSSDRACSKNAKYYIPFFLERPGPRYMQWSVNAHEARPGHHTQVRSLCCSSIPQNGPSLPQSLRSSRKEYVTSPKRRLRKRLPKAQLFQFY